MEQHGIIKNKYGVICRCGKECWAMEDYRQKLWIENVRKKKFAALGIKLPDKAKLIREQWDYIRSQDAKFKQSVQDAKNANRQI